MKKLFLFKSHSVDNANGNQHCSLSTDKQVSWEKSTGKGEKSSKKMPRPQDPSFHVTPHLRRSLSFSFGSPCDCGKKLGNYGDQNGSSNATKHPGQDSPPCYQTLTPERQTWRRNAAPRAHSDASEISSDCSSRVLDLYIDDGEQQLERHELKTNFSSFNNQLDSRNGVVKRPPRFQSGVCDARSQKPKSLSFQEGKTSQFHHSSKDVADVEYIDSPRKLAKHVVERLSHPQTLSKMGSKEVRPDIPITIEDVYGRTMNRCSNGSYLDRVSSKKSLTDWVGEDDSEMDIDLELLKKFKEAEERAELLSQELVNVDFLQLGELNVPSLVQTFKRLTEEKLNMAIEVSSVLGDRISELDLFQEKLKVARVEHESRTRRLEKEKNELQLVLEKELDRRSTEWSLKLEKYHTEEQMLRERVRELAEQNVNLQREICSYNEKEKDVITKIAKTEKQLEDMSVQVKDAMEENHHMHKTLSELTEKTRGAEEERDCIRRCYEEKATECKDMHQAIVKLQRTCTDQEKTIFGLRQLCQELGQKKSQEDNDRGLEKLKIEHMRLTGVENSLRKEVESYQVQVNSLRQENIDLLNRLKHLGKEAALSTFKLDQELQSRITCLQNQIIPLLTESSQLSKRLLNFVKTSSGGSPANTQFLVECEVKIQGLQRAAENFSVSMDTVSDVFQEKLLLCNFHSTDMDMHNQNKQKSEDIIRSELKAEMLLTKLLRDKLYSKEQETEQLQAEIASAVRGSDILKRELQNAVDEMSCTNHKMKEFELQMMKKDEAMKEVEWNLQERKKELTIVKGVLTNVSEERDMIWEKMKHYDKNNMLLSREMDMLRKKIEALDDEILLKEGQISILKDTITKPVDLLSIPELADDKTKLINR